MHTDIPDIHSSNTAQLPCTLQYDLGLFVAIQTEAFIFQLDFNVCADEPFYLTYIRCFF